MFLDDFLLCLKYQMLLRNKEDLLYKIIHLQIIHLHLQICLQRNHSQ